MVLSAAGLGKHSSTETSAFGNHFQTPWKQTGKVTQHKTGFLETSRNMELAKNQMRPP